MNARLPDHAVSRVQHEGNNALVVAEHGEFEIVAGIRRALRKSIRGGTPCSSLQSCMVSA